MPIPPVPAVQATPVISDLQQKAVTWILVDTRRRTLTVFEGEKEVRVFAPAAVGSGGGGIKKKRGDQITPTGRFTIGSIHRSKRFRWFILLNYPSLDYAYRARESGVIDAKVFREIELAHSNGIVPPQDTALGGYIGIHGVGEGSLKVHRLLDWTDGCIALDNGQIEELAKLVTKSTPVEIK